MMSNVSSNSAQPRWYVTTAIPYVNAKPHIGFAQELVLTDALARYLRLKGEDVWSRTGTDENSLKNVQSAEREGIPAQILVDRNAVHFYALRNVLNLSFDDFIRTSVEPRHLAGVEKLWKACEANGDIYKRAYSGLYCIGCEQFYTQSELVNGLCSEHLTTLRVVEEENYFFRPSRYADRRHEIIESDQLQIVPQKRKNEVLSFIGMWLNDFSISRSHARAPSRGIPVPGDPAQVIYVWFDALGNYITALGYAHNAPLYEHCRTNNPHRVHVIGKRIIGFHAIYWSAMLLSANVPLPTTIFVHDYVTMNGEKIGKSPGNVVDPVELVDRSGTDAQRYYLLREIPTTQDGDFTLKRFIGTYNVDLADQFGNLLHHVVSMIRRYYSGRVPAPKTAEDVDRRFIETAQNVRERVDTTLAGFALNKAMAAIWDLMSTANKYMVEAEPWTPAKLRTIAEESTHAGERLATVLYNLVVVLRLVAHYRAPFLPSTAEALAHHLGIGLDTGRNWKEGSNWGQYPAGTAVQIGDVLFPKSTLQVGASPRSPPAGSCQSSKTLR